MGNVRGFEFANVIGIGGRGYNVPEILREKINWIGIGASKIGEECGHPVLAFEKFILLNNKFFADVAPLLANVFYQPHAPRYRLNFSAQEQYEIDAILLLARNAKPSAASASLRKVKGHGCK